MLLTFLIDIKAQNLFCDKGKLRDFDEDNSLRTNINVATLLSDALIPSCHHWLVKQHHCRSTEISTITFQYYNVKGVASEIFQRGTESSDEGAKILFA